MKIFKKQNDFADTGIEPVAKKKKPKKWVWIVLIIVGLALIGSAFGGSSDSSSDNAPADTTPVENSQQTTEPESSPDTTDSESSQEATPEPEKAETVYNAYTVDTLMNELTNNALAATETHKGEYVEITGRLDVIDAQGKYIGVYSSSNQLDFIGVKCMIKSKEMKETVMALSTGSTVTVRGKVTQVGEIIGYVLNIDEIVG